MSAGGGVRKHWLVKSNLVNEETMNISKKPDYFMLTVLVIYCSEGYCLKVVGSLEFSLDE
jgi:hypothetical protein